MITLQRTAAADRFSMRDVVLHVFKMLKDEERMGKIRKNRELLLPGVDESHRSFKQRDRGDVLLKWADALVDDPIEQWGRFDRKGSSSEVAESQGRKSSSASGLGGSDAHHKEITLPDSRQAFEGLTFDDQSGL
jgi:hypothetical protein